jgi:HMGL-like
VRAVARTVDAPTVASLCRTRKEDLEASTEALAGARRSRLHVFIATSPAHMEKKLGLEPQEVVEHVRARARRPGRDPRRRVRPRVDREMEAGEPELRRMRREAADQPIEEVGRELRSLMQAPAAEAHEVH